jgi:hypothetical protein
MVWLHDYGKALDFDNQYQMTLSAGRQKLTELGFAADFVDRAVQGIETMDKKMEIDLHDAPLEVQIVSSADGCSHFVGPFIHIFWHEATDKTFTGKTLEGLMALNRGKIKKDWERKITLPEAQAAFQQRYLLAQEQAGLLPEAFIDASEADHRSLLR